VFHTAEGGAVETNSAALADRVEKLRNFGIASEGANELVGTNAKMSELSAALGLANLELLAGQMARRDEIHRRYQSRLAEIPHVSLIAPKFPDSNFRCRYAVVRVGGTEGARDRLNAFLHSRGIVTRRYFYPLTSDFAMYREDRGAQSNNLPVASQAAREVLALPFHGGLSEPDVDYICDCIKEFSGHG
jgi:dTDP-4-amino-4,6-dideoxygalactose transaminase